MEKMNEFIMETVKKTLKDYGIDWILQERQSNSNDNDFEDLMSELEIALEMVID